MDLHSACFVMIVRAMPWPRRVIATLFALTPAVAVAEPVTVMIGPEVRKHLTGPSEGGDLSLDPNTKDGAVGGLVASIAYPISPGIAVGVHGGMASRRYGTMGVGLDFTEHYDYRRIIADVAATLQVNVGRLWIAPWLGRHVTRRRTDARICTRHSFSAPWECDDVRTVEWTDDYTSFGATAGIDLVRIGAHSITAFVDAQAGLGAYAAVSAGVGYRLDVRSAATRSVIPPR